MTPEHLERLGSVLLLGHVAAVCIVNATPTPKDDDALDRYQKALVFVYRLIEVMAGIGPMAKR
jgi:hypothetical protein